jgi:hypothetical protein
LRIRERRSLWSWACLALSLELMLSGCTVYQLGATAPSDWGVPVSRVDSSPHCPALAGTFEDVLEGAPGNAGASDQIGDPPRPVDEAGLVGPMRLSYLLLSKILDPPPEQASLTLDQDAFAVSVRGAGKILGNARFSHPARQFSCAGGQLQLRTRENSGGEGVYSWMVEDLSFQALNDGSLLLHRRLHVKSLGYFIPYGGEYEYWYRVKRSREDGR